MIFCNLGSYLNSIYLLPKKYHFSKLNSIVKIDNNEKMIKNSKYKIPFQIKFEEGNTFFGNEYIVV